jgi:hypothetical protein
MAEPRTQKKSTLGLPLSPGGGQVNRGTLSPTLSSLQNGSKVALIRSSRIDRSYPYFVNIVVFSTIFINNHHRGEKGLFLAVGRGASHSPTGEICYLEIYLDASALRICMRFGA